MKAIYVTCKIDVSTDPVDSDPLGKSQVQTQQGLVSLRIGGVNNNYLVIDAIMLMFLLQ